MCLIINIFQIEGNCFPIWVGEMEKFVSYLVSFTFAIILAFHIILKVWVFKTHD
jgi:hypothetical protein